MINQLCDYGCGKEGKYQFKNGKLCCSRNYQQCPLGKKLNPKTEEWKRNHSKMMKGIAPWHKGTKGKIKRSEENKRKASERMKKKIIQ